MLPGGIPAACVTVGRLVEPGSAMQEGSATGEAMTVVRVADTVSPAQFGSKFFQFVTWEVSSGLSQQLHNIPVPVSVSAHTHTHTKNVIIFHHAPVLRSETQLTPSSQGDWSMSSPIQSSRAWFEPVLCPTWQKMSSPRELVPQGESAVCL